MARPLLVLFFESVKTSRNDGSLVLPVLCNRIFNMKNMISSSFKMSKKKNRKAKPGNAADKIRGIISINLRGVGYLANAARPDDEDLEIETSFLKTALNGDLVEAISHPKKKGRRLQGEVV